MKIDVLTLFPDFFKGPLAQSMMRKAAEQKLAEFNVHDLRQWGIGKRRTVDDIPYGGGAGMVLRPEPLFQAFDDLASPDMYRIYLTPQGKPFRQADAERLAEQKHLILLAGHYEGTDYRVRERLIDEEISIGDYVLTGGELPALVLIDAMSRFVPGVIDDASQAGDSFAGGLLEHPQYTRPESFRGMDVPAILFSGHHAEVDRWRRRESLRRTLERRPDLLAVAPLTDADRVVLDELRGGGED